MHGSSAGTSAAAQPASGSSKRLSLIFVEELKKRHTPVYEHDQVLNPHTPTIDSDGTLNTSPKGGVKLDSKSVLPLRLLFISHHLIFNYGMLTAPLI